MADETTKKFLDYTNATAIRRSIISRNRSIRMSNVQQGTDMPLIPVPDLPSVPMRRAAYEPDGTYYGVLHDYEDVPEGYTVKLVKAIW